MASDPSPAIDVNASSATRLHSALFDRQIVSIGKGEHIKLKYAAHYSQTQFSRLSSRRERDVQHLKDPAAQRDKHYVDLISGHTEDSEIIEIEAKAYCRVATFAQDTTLTAALLDRLLHHVRVVPIAEESYRLKHQRQAGTVQCGWASESAQFWV